MTVLGKFYELTSDLPNSYTEILSSSTLFGARIVLDMTKMRFYWSGL